VATVSRWVNGTATVSSEVAGRVQAAMDALKYTPYAAARKLATLRSDTLGILLADMHGDFFGPMLSGIESCTSQAGYDLLISTSHRPSLANKFPGTHNTDGLLVFADSQQSG
jgi:LacI family transcriptional regulator